MVHSINDFHTDFMHSNTDNFINNMQQMCVNNSSRTQKAEHER